MNRQDVARVIKATATYYGRQIEPEVLSMMCDDLSDLSATKVVEAYAQYRRNPKNRIFPLPAQIREMINPGEFIDAESMAREVAARITGAIVSYGWCNAEGAKAHIGREGWAAVQRAGGWMHLCENVGVTIPPATLQAQLRDQLEGVFRYGLPAIERKIGAELTQSSARGLESVGDIVKRITERLNE